jgi:hypothetical protein
MSLCRLDRLYVREQGIILDAGEKFNIQTAQYMYFIMIGAQIVTAIICPKVQSFAPMGSYWKFSSNLFTATSRKKIVTPRRYDSASIFQPVIRIGAALGGRTDSIVFQSREKAAKKLSSLGR